MIHNCDRFILNSITGQLERVPSRQAINTLGDTRADSPSALVNRGQLAIPLTFSERDSKPLAAAQAVRP